MFLCCVPWNTAPGAGGCLDFCRRLETVRNRLGTGFSLVGASRPILTVIDDVGQAFHSGAWYVSFKSLLSISVNFPF